MQGVHQHSCASAHNEIYALVAALVWDSAYSSKVIRVYNFLQRWAVAFMDVLLARATPLLHSYSVVQYLVVFLWPQMVMRIINPYTCNTLRTYIIWTSGRQRVDCSDNTIMLATNYILVGTFPSVTHKCQFMAP